MRRNVIVFSAIILIWSVMLFYASMGVSQQRTPPDAVEDAQTPRPVQSKRPEQQKTSHDQADVFSGSNAPPFLAGF